MFFKQFLKWMIIAFVIASPIAWLAGNNWLQNFAYKIAIEWWIFAAVGLSVALISLLTIFLQNARAAFSNPVDSLRTE